MKNDYNKDYFEKYALLSLVYCYDDKLQSMKKHERPDWIDENRSIGLEVTRALSSTDGEINSIINRYFGKGYSPEEIINKAKQINVLIPNFLLSLLLTKICVILPRWPNGHFF